MADDEEDWIEVRRFDDALEAQMVRDFLVEHGVRVGIRGNSGATGLLNRFTTVLDIRLVVPRADLEAAAEALEAMAIPPGSEDPFRGRTPAAGSQEEGEERAVRRRSPLAGAALALILPFGAGHLYAQHGAAAAVFAAGALGALLAMALGHAHLVVAWAVLVALDAAGAFVATRRYNASSVPGDGAQRKWSTLAVAFAFTVAVLVGT